MASRFSSSAVLMCVACFPFSAGAYLRRSGAGPALQLGTSKYTHKAKSFLTNGVRLRLVGDQPPTTVLREDEVGLSFEDVVGVNPLDSAPEDLSMFISVFSARANKERREVIRDLANKTTDDVKSRILLKFHLCELNPEDKEDPSIREQALAEKERYGDIVFLHCKEGLQRGKMALKAKLALENYHNEFNSKSLFMHIEDDTFVPWKRALSVLAGFNDMSWIYMGTEVPEGAPVNRDSDSPWYQPADVYSQETYPQYFKKEAYILGSALVSELIESNIMEELPLSNQDQALGVWVDTLKQRGKPAFALVVDPPSKNADGLQIPYVACGDKWSHYPFMWQHGLQAEDMSCLGKWDVQDVNEQLIDSCLTDCEQVR